VAGRVTAEAIVILHEDELALAREYNRRRPGQALTAEQMKLILDRGRALHRWYKHHQAVHYALNLGVLSFLLVGDGFILLRLPGLVLGDGATHAAWTTAAASLLCGSLHSILLYSLSVFSMHEGAAHRALFPGPRRWQRALNWGASNVCRIAATEPGHYAEHHMSHHAKFGTTDDGEFLNFVRPRRYWLTLLPFAAFLNYSDFVAHRPHRYTRGRVASAVVALTYHTVYGALMAVRFGALVPALAFVLFLPHVGFFLDRLRQFSEHNLMPLANKDGSRSLGLGFWGLLVGGGPWGSPCHWEHHLVPSLPWYQQLLLHRYVKGLLTPEQRPQFLLTPVVGYPRLLIRLWSEPGQFAESLRALGDEPRPAGAHRPVDAPGD
jgi:hypothetical protein